jgi:MoxR-like ATPase
MEFIEVQQFANRIKENVGRVIVGKDDVIDLMLVSLLSSGHVLLEDVPGTGKTLLAKTLARSMACSFQRIQFTPDLLPSDVSGIHYYNQKSGEFEFRPGPLFANIVLSDEINRATPRTQSSLLECMEERQISIDGTTHKLEQPFMVLATQNPIDNQGTFPLPEAQLDRFIMKVRMGYPEADEGVRILARFREHNPLESIDAVVSKADIVAAQRKVASVAVSDDLLRYIVQIAEATRSHSEISLGVSPRATQALLRCSQAAAVLAGREYVWPDDIKAMAVPVLAHRILLKNRLRASEGQAESMIQRILASVAVPTEDGIGVV